MNIKKIGLGVAPATVLAVGGLSACGAGTFDKATEQFKDAPIGPRVNKPVTIIEMPDGYANVATVCHNGMRYSTTTVGTDARAVSVVEDPACKE